jgi:hypothetical protein
MYASRMMTRMTTTNQKKNTTIPGMTYPATLLVLATASSYPAPPGLSATSSGLERVSQLEKACISAGAAGASSSLKLGIRSRDACSRTRTLIASGTGDN